MADTTTSKCSTSNCDNRATVKAADTAEPLLVCGSCWHGMMMAETEKTMSEGDRVAARQLLKDWCDPKAPKGWEMREPGFISRVGDAHGGLEYWVDVRDRYFRSHANTGRVPVEIVDIALRSIIAGMAPALAGALTNALDDGDCLRGVIARAVEASNSIADRDAEDAIQEMLQHLLEVEPEGHDDRIEWARMEGANAMLEVILQAGYGARGIADNRDGLRRTVAELAVAATMPRKPEPEFEAALLQREVEQLRAQLAAQQEAADKRVAELTSEWRKEPDRLLVLLGERTRERDEALRLVDKQRYRIVVDENDLDEAGLFDDDGFSVMGPHPKILAWMAVNGFEFSTRGHDTGIWRGDIFVRPGEPRADEDVVNDLANSVDRPPMDVLAEIAAMVVE